MTARDLGLGIVLVEVDVREYPAIGIPSSYVSLSAGNRKFLTNSAAAFYDQLAAHLGIALLTLLFIGPEGIGPAPGGKYQRLPRTLRLGIGRW